jgi:hypothetical protein
MEHDYNLDQSDQTKRPAHRPRQDPAASRINLRVRIHPETHLAIDASAKRTGKSAGQTIDQMAMNYDRMTPIAKAIVEPALMEAKHALEEAGRIIYFEHGGVRVAGAVPDMLQYKMGIIDQQKSLHLILIGFSREHGRADIMGRHLVQIDLIRGDELTREILLGTIAEGLQHYGFSVPWE